MSNRPAGLEPGARPDDDIWYENKRSPVSAAQQDHRDHHPDVEGQLSLPFPEETTQPQERTGKGESPRKHEFVTGFALAKTHDGDWVAIGDITNVLDIERPPSDDEVRHGSSEAAEFLRMTRLISMLKGPQPQPHSH